MNTRKEAGRSAAPDPRKLAHERAGTAEPSDRRGATADDITVGDEAQARREKMQRQEKSEGER